MSDPTEDEHPEDSPLPASVERATSRLAGAERTMVLSGAGISVASGMPTFRGEDGLWKGHRPEDLATPGAFRRDPRAVWEWYAWRRRKARECSPNPAHRWLARWCLADPDVVLLTQNVDDLHRRALEQEAGGTGGERGREEGARTEDAAVDDDGEARARGAPVELHGNLFRARCTGCGRRGRLSGPVDASSAETLPRCGDCGELLRPDVVWFGESLDRGVLERASSAARRAGACLVVGTSAVVQPAASLASSAARGGAAVVEVNPAPTPLSRLAEVTVRADAAVAVPAILRPLLRDGP